MTSASQVLEQSVVVFSQNYSRRDNYACQYCGSSKRLTIARVVSLSKGGLHTWNNVVTACERCNQYKSDRTPHQTGIPLHFKLKAPIHPTVAFAEKFWRSEHLPPGIGGNSISC